MKGTSTPQGDAKSVCEDIIIIAAIHILIRKVSSLTQVYNLWITAKCAPNPPYNVATKNYNTLSKYNHVLKRYKIIIIVDNVK
jgi:hypothetical protein